MYSIYSFWKDIISKKDAFRSFSVLKDFPFDQTSFSYVRMGAGFPNFVIKTNKDKSLFTGGEFIKLKSRNNYSIAPFRSLIPSGKVNINILPENITQQWQNIGSGEHLLRERDVYFLIYGHKGRHHKICLVHGSFFETVDEKELIYQSLIQPLAEKLSKKSDFLDTFVFDQEGLKHIPDVKNATVKFGFKFSAEVKPEGNILNSKRYPEILDDTLNLVIPYHTDQEEADVISKLSLVVGQRGMKEIKTFSIKHPLNGWFVVFQVNL